jgi:hypothetical protein
MESTRDSVLNVPQKRQKMEHALGLFSTESVLNLEKLIFAVAPLSEFLTNIARLAESHAEGMSCTIWLPMSTPFRSKPTCCRKPSVWPGWRKLSRESAFTTSS